MSEDIMGLPVLPRNRVLAHQDATDRNVGWRSPDAPPNITSAIVKLRKDKPSRLMRRGFGQDGNGKTSDANGMQNDRGIVQKAKNVHTE